MKKIKLFALAIMAMLSTNAFAADADITASVTVNTGGSTYSPVVDGKAPLTYKITKVMDNNGDGKFKTGEVCVYENGAEMKELESITIPATVVIPIKIGTTESTQTFTVTAIGDGTNQAFTATNSNKLATLTIGANVALINANAFKDVATLATVTFGGAETEIGNHAFYGTIISALTLPSKLQTIGNFAFAANGSKYPTFSTLAIPATVKTIGESAFEGCENLSTVTLAASSQLNTIGDGAFAYTSLTELDLSNATAYDATPAVTTDPLQGMTAFGTDGTEYGPFTSATHKNTSLITKVVLPTTCVTVNQSACQNLQYLSEIDLKNVTTIGATAFSGCKALATATIGTANTATTFTGISIGANAFAGCVKLATVEVGKIKDGEIANNAFGAGTEEAPYAAVTTFKFNAIDKALGTTAWNLATVTTIEFKGYISGADFIPSGAFTNAFGGATPDETKTYTITYTPTLPAASPVTKPFHVNAFAAAWAAAPVITLKTVSSIEAAYTTTLLKVKVNGGYTTAFTIGKGEEGSKVLIKDKNSSSYYYYYKSTGITEISKEQQSGANVTVYQAYTDGSADEVDIYLMPLQVKNGKYGVADGQVVIIKSNKEAGCEAAPGTTATMLYNSENAIINGLKITTEAKSKLAVLADATLLNNGANDVWFFNNPATSGFGFTKYDTAKQNGLGANTVYFQTSATAAAPRLNIIWLDEEGNTTAIQKVELENTSINNDAIYNVAGQKVSASYKGLVIKGGKKYIQK